ncbi:hypothetical protein AAL_02558 [Moelleriella libera RCEF 2490]|uniref:Uncharacterized protein n=1 Tax=Moelleriella libera RCEF 2490 TaxID=1081109 RepID=A0A168EP75_9HYPO|nr:hypothetical protein AAL_02558 [Moelleriella libera RCEF 2490]
MHRSWSKRLSGAMPLRGEDKAHRHSSHRDEASGSSSAAAAGGGRRPTSVYVPTHAASSFVQTASRHEPVNTSSPAANGGVAPPHTRSTQLAKKHRQQTASMDSTMSSLSSSSLSSTAGMPSDYATFLVEAEANDRAIRSCIAHRRREHDRESSAPHAYASWPQYYKQQQQQQQQQQQRHSKRQQRDSAYYSIASRSSVSAKPATKRDSMLSMSAHHHPQQQQQQQQGQGQAPSPRSGLTRKGTKTLGRRISEYFKPPTRHQPVCCEY